MYHCINEILCFSLHLANDKLHVSKMISVPNQSTWYIPSTNCNHFRICRDDYKGSICAKFMSYMEYLLWHIYDEIQLKKWKIKAYPNSKPYSFSAECTAISTNEDCCSSASYLCGHNQGNCKSNDDCLNGLTCEDTCPDDFPVGYKCCFNSGKYIFDP